MHLPELCSVECRTLLPNGKRLRTRSKGQFLLPYSGYSLCNCQSIIQTPRKKSYSSPQPGTVQGRFNRNRPFLYMCPTLWAARAAIDMTLARLTSLTLAHPYQRREKTFNHSEQHSISSNCLTKRYITYLICQGLNNFIFNNINRMYALNSCLN